MQSDGSRLPSSLFSPNSVSSDRKKYLRILNIDLAASSFFFFSHEKKNGTICEIKVFGNKKDRDGDGQQKHKDFLLCYHRGLALCENIFFCNMWDVFTQNG